MNLFSQLCIRKQDFHSHCQFTFSISPNTISPKYVGFIGGRGGYNLQLNLIPDAIQLSASRLYLKAGLEHVSKIRLRQVRLEAYRLVLEGLRVVENLNS